MKYAVLIATCFTVSAMAQTASTKAAADLRTPANLAQLMRGIIYPSSNVIFAAQTQNPAEIKLAADPRSSSPQQGELIARRETPVRGRDGRTNPSSIPLPAKRFSPLCHGPGLDQLEKLPHCLG